MIHLDTSFLIRALVPGSPEDRALRRWMAAGEGVAMSTIAWAELLCGPLEDRHRVLATRIVVERVPFVAEGSEIAARLYNDTGRRRGSLGEEGTGVAILAILGPPVRGATWLAAVDH